MLTQFGGTRAEYGRLPPYSGDAGIVSRCRVNTLVGLVIPNVFDWRAGDVVLSSAHPPNMVDPISIYQSFLYPDVEQARWTHVGIYDGDGTIWDANPDTNVQARSVGDYILSKGAISIVRLRHAEIDPGRLQEEIFLLKGRRYDMRPLAAMLLMRVFAGVGKLRPREPDAEAVVCSTFLEHVFRHLGYDCFAKISVVVPADYAGSDAFQLVPLRWHRLE
jgi:hypothetical protein